MRWTVLVTSFFTYSLVAQVQVSVVLREPLPAAISAWQEDPTLIRIIITAPPGTPAYPQSIVGFELRDIQTSRIIARSKNGHPQQPRINIPAGPATLVLTGRDIVHQQAVYIDPSIEAQTAATGFLPEGRYEFCTQLYDQYLRPIAATGVLCPTTSLATPDPPVLLSPADSSRLSTTTPLFTWAPAQPMLGSVLYRLRIAPLYPRQDRRSALERNPPVVEQTLTTTAWQYLPTAPPFSLYPDAEAFVWQVQAITPDGRPAARNEGKSAIFLFYPPSLTPTRERPETERRAPGTVGTVDQPSSDTVFITHIRLGGGFIMRLHTPIRCKIGTSCSIGPDTGFIFIPWLGDTLVAPFGTITVSVPTPPNIPQLSSGTIITTAVKERLLRSGAAVVNHVLRILQWEFTPSTARAKARALVDWSSVNFGCRTVDSIELGWQPVSLVGLPPLRIKLPTAWNCSGEGMLLGSCFQAKFDSIIVHARFDTLPPRSFTGHLTLGGQLQISCLNPPVTAYFYLRLDRGGADFVVTLISPVRNTGILGTPLRISLDTLVLDLASDTNPPGFPPSGTCSFSDWSSPNWRGLWLPSVRLSVLIGDNDTTTFLVHHVVAEDIGGQLKLSLSARNFSGDTIRLAGFRVRLDSVYARWCRGTFSQFAFRGLILLPSTLSKPATWAQLDSLYLRLTCDASWNWIGSLDIYGHIQLDFGTFARLTLQNGQLVKVGPGSGYIEFGNIRLTMPANGSNSLAFNGLRIWHDGRVELGGAEGWIHVASWANLTVAGITVQAQEVGLGYHLPTGSCSGTKKRWWIGISGGVSIDAASGLPGGSNGVRVRRLRIYDDLCISSEGVGVDVSVSGVFSIRGDLQWGTITYGSGSGSVQAQGLRGTLSGRFTCLGGLEAQVDFALGSAGTPAYRFWFIQGAAVVPGGVPIVPGVFHLVGGTIGAGWHVRLDPVNHSQISEASGIVPPPPLVPDPGSNLLLRGGLIFADASLQFYRLTVTGTVAIGSSTQLGIDGGIVILPALNLVRGTASATVSIINGRLQPPISLSGGAEVRLLRIPVFSAGFNSSFTPGSGSCFQVGPLQRQWILADLDANVGTDILGIEVVAKAYAQLAGYLRLCPTEGSFTTNFGGAGVVGVKLQVAKIGTVPFHFALSYNLGLCGFYFFRIQRSANQYTARAKLGGALEVTANFDQSGFLSWGWKGTQAADHLQGFYCGSGNWVDLSQHWRHCRKQDKCDKEAVKCRQVSVTLQARGIFDGQITIPRTCFTVAGRQVCLPKLHETSISAQYGYYGYGRFNNREGAKKGGPLGTVAEQLSCTSLLNEAQNWTNQNVSEQQPPALITSSTPGRGQTGVPVTQLLSVQLGAPADGTSWSSGGNGLRQWQLRNLSVQLQELGMGNPRQVNIRQHLSGSSTLEIRPTLQRGGVVFPTILMPNTRYRLIVEADFWARNPDGSQSPVTPRSRDTVEFTTGTVEGLTFIIRSSVVQHFRNTSLTFTPGDIHLYSAHNGAEQLWVPLQFGRDLWLRIRDGAGRTYEWRGPLTTLIRGVTPLWVSGIPFGVRLQWDTLQLQPRVVSNEGGYFILPNSFTFTLINAKKAGSAANRPDTADRLLDGLPSEVDRWTWIRFPSAEERQLGLSTRVRWKSSVTAPEVDGVQAHPSIPGAHTVYTVHLHNVGPTKLLAGTPFWIIVRRNMSGTIIESRTPWYLPKALGTGHSIPISVTVPTEAGFQGASIWILPRFPFHELDNSDNCVDTGMGAGCAQCHIPPGCGIIPVPIGTGEQ